MKSLPVREAKASFSALLVEAERGRPTLITRHGKPSAMLVPVEAGRKLYPMPTISLVDYLMTAPDEPPFEREPSPLRDVEL